MNTANKVIVTSFIEKIWNENRLEEIGQFLSPDFTDHSLPPNLPPNADGMKLWIIGTGKSFEHKTIIDEMVCEGDKVMLRIKMQLKHIGTWRGIEATHFEISTTGYRYYKLANEKIIEHWGLIDGNSIEDQLHEATRGCKIHA